MKRKLLTVFSLLLSLIGILLIGSACRQEDEFKPEEHDVIEEYYYDANGAEYLITLYSDDFFTLSIAGEEGEGKYALEGSTLTLTLGEKGGEIVATISDNVLNLTYKEVAYNFRLKVDYTVQFDAKGGTTVADAKVLNGKTVAKPADPTKDGEVFIGWYTDEAFRNLYEFSRPVTGNMKLYARFVTPIDPEFTVKFDAGEGASAVNPMTTKGGKLYDPELPTPTKSGAEFVGWYVSQFYTAEKLTYRYHEQPIEENITLYAVWDEGNPVVSVNETGVEVVGMGLGERYNITITAPDGTKPVDGVSSSSANYAYNFAAAVKGEYMVEVTIGDKTTVRYYNNKALARVSVFEAEESTILFNAVPNATKYLLTVTCGTEGHRHEDIDLGDRRSWSFENCDMPADGIKFVVKAEADGYVTSVSEPFTYTRSLPAVTKVTVNSATETATWDAVSGATSYFVTVQKGADELYAGNIGEATSFDLKYFPEGSYTVKVRPVARGWNSPADTACSYEKTRIATPKGLTYTGSGFTWGAVDGADKYIVTIDGKDYESTTTTLSLEGIEFNGAKEAIEITVRAIKGSAVSLDSDVVTLRATLGNIRYAGGTLSWDAVTGVTHYVVTVDGGEPIEVEGTSYNVTFTRAGNCTLAVSARLEGGVLSVPKELTVVTYEIKFEMDRAGAAPLPSIYVAENDPIPYPDSPTFHGYTFEHWYTAPGGADGEGTVYDDVTFRDKQTRTLYAGWTANEHTLTFDVGQFGEELTVESVKVRFGESKTVDGEDLPVPTSKDQTRAFAGWYLDANHSTQLTDFRGQIVSGGFLQDADVKLYAYYVEVFKFEDDAQGGVSVSKGPGIVQGIVTEAKIPEQYGGKTVTRIIDFSDSVSLEVLHIPDTVTTILLGSEGNAFRGCKSLREIEVYKVEGNTDEVRYSSDNGVLLDTTLGEKFVRFYPAAKSGAYTIPDGVTTIPLGSFVDVTGLTKLSVSYTVSQIQEGAFNGCTSLQEIEFLPTPNGTIATQLDIRDGAFESCDAITKIHIPTRLASVTADTFSALTNLEEFTADDGGKYVAIDGLLCTNYEGGASTEYEVIFVPKGKALGDYTIPGKIVSIGARAFYEHPKLTGITIPGYVRHIGQEAFGHIVDSANKAALTSITFKGLKDDPDLVIEEKAFYAGYKTSSGGDSGSNTLVTELRLPANLVTLGRFAFGKYTNLKEVYVDTDRTSVDYADYVFAADSTTNISYVTTAHIGPACPAFSYSGVFGSKLASIDVDKGNPYVKSEDDVVYDANGANILFFPVDKSGDFSIPDGVLEIAPSAFAGRTALESISIPASVTVVGENAFNNCDELTTVTFREPKAGEEAKPLEIKQRAFYACEKLSTITLPERLEHLGSNVFWNCDALTSIELPKNLKIIDIAKDTSGRENGYDVFQGCDKLKDITVDKENQYFTGIDGVIYAVKGVKLSPNAAELSYVPYEALFSSPGATGTINVPGTVRIVRKYSFRGDFVGVEKIVFEDLQPLYNEKGELDTTEFTFEQYGLYATLLELKQIGPNSYTVDYNSTLKEIVLPEGVKTLSKNLIYNWKGLTSITIPSTVETIEIGAFSGCVNIASVTFAKAKSGDEVPLSIGVNPDSTTATAANGVFSNYTSVYENGKTNYYTMPITSMVLPARTKYIGDYTFYHSDISSVTFDGKVSNLQIGNNAFAYCEKLTDFTIPEGTTLIGKNAFSYSGLTSIKMSDTVKYIGDYAFAYMKGDIKDKTLTIPASTKMIGQYAFYSSNSSTGSKAYHFETIDFSKAKNLELIGSRMYYNNSALTTIKFAEATDDSPALTIGGYAFSQLSNLKSLTLPANISKLGAEYDMTKVTDGDIKVGDHFAKSTTKGDVFYLDSALKEVVFDTFKSGANQGKSMLSLIETQTFRKTGLQKLTLPESTAEDGIQLGTKLFIYCTSLTEVHLSKSVKSIDNVFTGCGKLQKVTVDAGSDFFSESENPDFPALYDAAGESVLFVYAAVNGQIKIASGTRIGAGAFAGQTEITSVIIGPTVQVIDARAFENCINLASVTFEEGSVLTTIGEYAFSSCYKLSSINLEACTHLQTLGTYYAEVGKPGASGYAAAYYSGYIFNGCDNLKINVKIASPDLQNVGRYAFSYCGITGVDLSVCTALTELNNYAFAQNDALTSVKFPSSLEFLGTYTFANSDTIEEIDLSNTKIAHLSDVKGEQQTIMYLGKEDLKNASGAMTALLIFDCDNLKVIKLPATLRTVGYEAFMNSPALQEVYIGSGAKNDLSAITWFGPKAFYGSGMPSIKIAGNANFADKYHNGTSTSYYVGAFEGSTGLQKVEFEGGANLTSIPRGMFKDCAALSELDFTQLTNLATIGQDAFRGCGFTSVNLSACKGGSSFMTATYTFAECAKLSDVTLPNNVTKVGNYTFMGTGFTSLNLGKFSQFTSWGSYMFQNCLNLTEVTIPKGTTLATYLFDGCESLSTVTFEAGYKGTLPNYLFRNCAKLENLNLNDAVFTTLGTNVFQNCTALTSIDLSHSTATALGNYMFDGCEKLNNITVPATIKTAGTYTFRNCTSLTSIDLSKTKIDRFATGATGTVTATAAVHTFEGCTNLEKVTLPEGGVKQIGGQVFLNCTSLKTIENLDISKLTHIGKEAFRNCAYITGTVTLGKGLTILGEYAFADCYPTQYAIEDGATITGAKWGSIDVTFSAEGGLLIADEKGVKTAVAFGGSAEISDDTLKLKGDYAIASYFFENFNVEGVTKLDLSGLTATSLPNYALANSPFTEIVLPDTITTLGTNMFQNCVNLTKVNIPAGLTTLPNYCFDGCTSLAAFEFPETLTETGTYAFRGTGLTSITIPATVGKLGNYTFAETHELKSVTFKGNIATMGTYMFQNSDKLTTVDLGSQATLGVRMFQNTGITSIVIPATVTSVGNYAFVECHALKSVTFAGTLETLGTYTFQNCENLNTVQLPEGLTVLPSYIFNGCTALQKITIPETVTNIQSHAFDGSGLTSIEIPEAVETIGEYVFQNCVSLTGNIVLSDNVTSLGGNAFNGCTGITSVELSANVGTIANTVFKGWTAGQQIRVRNSRFETCASCGVAWLKDIAAQVIFDYKSQA